MKISGFGSKKVSKSSKSKKSSRGKKAGGSSVATTGASSSGSAEGGDNVEVVDHAETLELIRGFVGGTPDIRVDEVDRIVSQLKGGKYKINFEKVAESFIKEAILNEISKKGLKKAKA